MSAPIDRREFLRATAAGAVAAAGASPLGAGAAEAGKGKDMPMTPYREPARDTPLVERADVLVAGAGPAGVVAAIAAARAGAKVRLIEAGGCLGGTWTAGLLSWILDSGNKPGVLQDILAALRKRGTGTKYGGSVAYDVEVMKLVLEEMCLAAGVSAQLHTRVVAAGKEIGRLAVAVTESKSGRQAWAAKAFVDATGDGDLAARAGCEFDYGDANTGRAQPMSMICLLTGATPEGLTPFVRGLAEPAGKGNPKANLLAEMARAGVRPSYTSPTIFFIRDGLFCMMANHEYGLAGTSAADLTAATFRGRAEVHRLVDALRNLGQPWRDVRIVATAEHIGVREGRRVRGLYTITADDLAKGARFEDAVCRCHFPVDVHSTDPKKDKGIARTGVRAQPYDIPYRSLVARDVSGLLLAGRCISGDFIAHSSYRVTGDAAATGQAAGAAAALAARTGREPKDLPWAEIAGAIRCKAAASEVGTNP